MRGGVSACSLSRHDFAAELLAGGMRMLAFSVQYRRESTRSLRLLICLRRFLLVCYFVCIKSLLLTTTRVPAPFKVSVRGYTVDDEDMACVDIEIDFRPKRGLLGLSW